MIIPEITRFSNHRSSDKHARRGAITVLAAFLMAVLLGMVAFAVDLGYITLAKTETQRTADATAHAAALEFARSADVEVATQLAEQFCTQFAAANPVLGSEAAVSLESDVSIGRYEFGSGQIELYFDDPSTFNAVRVRIRRTSGLNGEVPLFFAHLLGKESQALEATATAALIHDISGFKIPPSGANVPMLPITVSEKLWDQGIGKGGTDDWSYDPETGSVWPGPDGIPEVILFPNKTGSAGNLGTVNIGVSNNSASYLASQIRNGLSHSDLEYHGGSIELNSKGELKLGGNPGLTASIKDDVQSIVGEPRIVPIYRKVKGNGNNAEFTIVKFVGIRVMHVKLTGKKKAIAIQPALTSFNGVIQSASSGTSEQIFSPPRLVN